MTFDVGSLWVGCKNKLQNLSYEEIYFRYYSRLYFYLMQTFDLSVTEISQLVKEVIRQSVDKLDGAMSSADVTQILEKNAQSVALEMGFYSRLRSLSNTESEALQKTAAFDRQACGMNGEKVMQVFGGLVAHLTGVQREIFYLYYVDEMPLPEVALHVHLDEKLVRSIVKSFVLHCYQEVFGETV